MLCCTFHRVNNTNPFSELRHQSTLGFGCLVCTFGQLLIASILHLRVFTTYSCHFQANLTDFSDNQWVTCFQESAEALLGKGADELGKLRAEVGLAGNSAYKITCTGSQGFENLHSRVITYCKKI